MTGPSWRRSWSVLDRMLAQLIWLHPATAAFFGSVAVEQAEAEVLVEVVSAPLAA